MPTRSSSISTVRRGIVSVLALQFLVLFMVLGVAFVSATNFQTQKSKNHRAAARARLAAESGMMIMLRPLRGLQRDASADDSTLLNELYTKLTTELSAVSESTVANWAPAMNGTAIEIPAMQLPSGQFSAWLTPVQVEGQGGVRLTVTGTADGISRQVSMDLAQFPSRSRMFNYSVGTCGSIIVSGNSMVGGSSEETTAMVLSMSSDIPAIQVSGSGEIGGELYVTGATEDYIDLGGASAESVSFGVQDPIPPTVDVSPFVPLAVNEYGVSGTSTVGSSTVYTNVRIPAGTNPTFSGDTVINGVIYIEAPNNVKFSGGTVINGIIVTEEDSFQDIANCQIEFRGSVTAPGVDALPDGDAQFTEIKKYTGTVILAPGFALDFAGNMAAVSGVIAADQISFSGNTEISGPVTGAIIGLKDYPMVFSGSSEIRMDPLEEGLLPAGFVPVNELQPYVDSYVESTVLATFP